MCIASANCAAQPDYNMLPICALADFLQLLAHWKSLKMIERLSRLVLADNPMLGRLAAGAGCIAAQDLLGMSRLFKAAQLELLDIRRTGWAVAWGRGRGRQGISAHSQHYVFVAACRLQRHGLPLHGAAAGGL